MSDSADTIRVESEADAIASGVQTWLTDNSGITSLDEVEIIRYGQGYTIVLFIYTA